MSCGSCKNFKGICCYPKYGKCHDSMNESEIIDTKKELRNRCAMHRMYGPREIDCPECDQRAICQEENNWSGDRIETEFERRQAKYKKKEITEITSPSFRVKKRDDGKYDVYLSGSTAIFHFVTDGEFIKYKFDLENE